MQIVPYDTYHETLSCKEKLYRWSLSCLGCSSAEIFSALDTWTMEDYVHRRSLRDRFLKFLRDPFASRLDLHHYTASTFPPIFHIDAFSRRVYALNLSHSTLSILPEDIQYLSHLEKLDLTDSKQLRDLTENIWPQLKNLSQINLDRCLRLRKLPDTLFSLHPFCEIYINSSYLDKSITQNLSSYLCKSRCPTFIFTNLSTSPRSSQTLFDAIQALAGTNESYPHVLDKLDVEIWLIELHDVLQKLPIDITRRYATQALSFLFFADKNEPFRSTFYTTLQASLPLHISFFILHTEHALYSMSLTGLTPLATFLLDFPWKHHLLTRAIQELYETKDDTLAFSLGKALNILLPGHELITTVHHFSDQELERAYAFLNTFANNHTEQQIFLINDPLWTKAVAFHQYDLNTITKALFA